MKSANGNGSSAWGVKEKVLMFSGLTLIALEAVAVTFMARPFHFEFVLAGLALCGVSLTQVGDKK